MEIKQWKKLKNAAFHTFPQREKCHTLKIDLVFPKWFCFEIYKNRQCLSTTTLMLMAWGAQIESETQSICGPLKNLFPTA